MFLANCHLMTKWLPSLEKLIQTVEKSKPNELFRLWLSSVPHEDFPIAILQRSVKLTAEPPKVGCLLYDPLCLYHHFQVFAYIRTTNCKQIRLLAFYLVRR